MNAARLSLLAACLAALSLPAPAADWPQWRGPDRTGISKETGLLKTWPKEGPKVVWTFEDAGAGYSGMAVVGDRLYTMGAKNQKEFVLALDIKTGKQVWAAEFAASKRRDRGDGPRGTPTVDGEFLYVEGDDGDIACLETAKGKIVWQKNLQEFGGKVPNWGYSESPLIDGEVLVCSPGGAKGTLIALDKKTGKVIWQSSDVKFGAHYSSIMPAELGGTKQYVQLTMDGVFSVAAKDGKLLWKVGVGGARTASVPTPIVHDGYVFVTSGYPDSKSALLRVTGDRGTFNAEKVWDGKQLINKHGGVVLVEGVLYGNQDGGRPSWLAVDFKTGDRFGWDNANLGKGSVTFADGRLYLYSEDNGTCVLLDPNPKEWKEHGRFKIPKVQSSGKVWTHPVVAGGKLYLREQSNIWCHDIKGALSP